jgi:hypothetical protein
LLAVARGANFESATTTRRDLPRRIAVFRLRTTLLPADLPLRDSEVDSISSSPPFSRRLRARPGSSWSKTPPGLARPTSFDQWAAAPLAAGFELAVIRLMIQGDTKREVASRLFISPHTVDSHCATRSGSSTFPGVSS